MDGQDSTALLPGGELPKGRTVRGTFDIRDYAAASSFGVGSSSISFGYRLSVAPTVQFVRIGQASTTQCPGTASRPEAASGYLCFYEVDRFNIHADYPIALHTDRHGTLVSAFSNVNTSTASAFFSESGKWAVTGN